MFQGQIDKSLKVAHRGTLEQAPTSLGRVRKGHFAPHGFITPNSLGADVIDNDRMRMLNRDDRMVLNERTPLSSKPPNQQEANKILLPLGMLQDSQSTFPFIANAPTNFVYMKEAEQRREEQEKDMLKETENILDRIEAINREKIKFV